MATLRWASACSADPFSAAAAKSIPWGPTTDDVDRTLSKKVDTRVPAPQSQDPSDPGYFMDIVSDIRTDADEYVDLQRNPERNTGYNGSSVWDAIYEENCFHRGASVRMNT